MLQRVKFNGILLAILALLTCQGPSAARAAGNAGAVFTPGPVMPQPFHGHWSICLPDGRLLLVGNDAEPGANLNTAQIWRPDTNSFTLYNLNDTRSHCAGARLNDGRYLFAGGWYYSWTNTAEIFNPADNSFTLTRENMHYGRVRFGAATLTDGRVLLVGPEDFSESELFDPVNETFSLTGPINVPRSHPVVLPTSDGKALVLGGEPNDGLDKGQFIEKVELYDPGTNQFSVLQETLFAGESGWMILGPPEWGSNLLEQQKLRDGRYLLLAVRLVASDAYEAAFFTVDPATKQIAKFPTTPSMGITVVIPGFPSPQVMVDQARNKAYFLIAVNAANQIRLLTLDLGSGRLTMPTGSYTLPSSYYLEGAGRSLLPDGRLFITGGRRDLDTDNPSNKTLFAQLPKGPGGGITLLLLGD